MLNLPYKRKKKTINKQIKTTSPSNGTYHTKAKHETPTLPSTSGTR